MGNTENHDLVQRARTTFERLSKIIPSVSPELEITRDLIARFLARGLRDARMTIKDPRSSTRVEIWKYIRAKGDYGIELILQRKDLSESHWEQLKAWCSRNNVQFDLHDDSGVVDTQSLRIDCGKDTDTAHAHLLMILEDVFGSPPRNKFDIDWKDVSRWDEVIESPDQKPSSSEAGIKLTKAKYEEKYGVRFGSVTLFGFCIVSQIIGILALAFILIFPRDDWWAFPIDLLGFGLLVPWPGVVAIVLLILGFLAILTDPYWTVPSGKVDSEFVQIRKTMRGGFYVFSRRPINWVSISLIGAAIYLWANI